MLLVPKGGSVLRAWPRSKTKSTMLNQIQTESHTVNRELGRVEEPFFDNCFVLALTTWNRKLATALSKDGFIVLDGHKGRLFAANSGLWLSAQWF